MLTTTTTTSTSMTTRLDEIVGALLERGRGHGWCQDTLQHVSRTRRRVLRATIVCHSLSLVLSTLYHVRLRMCVHVCMHDDMFEHTSALPRRYHCMHRTSKCASARRRRSAQCRRRDSTRRRVTCAHCARRALRIARAQPLDDADVNVGSASMRAMTVAGRVLSTRCCCDAECA